MMRKIVVVIWLVVAMPIALMFTLVEMAWGAIRRIGKTKKY